MNLSHLRYAAEVEKTGSITQAAENLYMGQPNLSKAIKELEKSVGFSIFKRTPRGMVPTLRGAEFLSKVKPVLRQIDDLETLYHEDYRQGTHFFVAVPRASYLMLAFTNFIHSLDFLQDMEIFYRETNFMQAVSDVAQGNCPLGIIRYGEEEEGFVSAMLQEKDLEAEPLFLFTPEIVISKSHPLAGNKTVNKEQLEPYIELVYGDEAYSAGFWWKGGEKAKENISRKCIRIYDRGSQLALLEQLPLSYMRTSPVPLEFADKYRLSLLKPSWEEKKMKDVLIYPKGHHLSVLEQAFREEIFRVRNEVARH